LIYISKVLSSNRPSLFDARENFPFQMAHLAQAAEMEAHRAERDRRRRIVSCLPKTSESAAFLVASAAMLLDIQDSVEDGASVAQKMREDDDIREEQQMAVAMLNNSILTTNELFSKLGLAARYDCSTVQATMEGEEPLPGVAAGTVRAVKAAYSAKTEAERELRESKPKGNWRNHPYAALFAAVAASGSGGQQPPQPPGGSGHANHSVQGRYLPPPVPASRSASPRERYPCYTCGIRGHWASDGVCRQEDVRAHIARLSAMISGGQLALPQPIGTSQTVTANSLLFTLNMHPGKLIIFIALQQFGITPLPLVIPFLPSRKFI
jgi:hypothetical protein